MRTLAVDLGARRVGLALSDEGGKFATPYDVLKVTSPQQAADGVIEAIQKEGVRRLVVGLPLNMDGTLGYASQNTIRWASLVNERANLPLVFVDERLSSFDAEQRLIERKRGGEKITRGRRKEILDAVAAAGFLQEFLDGKLPKIEVAPE
jgi:putative Holliday junction resolvase